MQNVKQYAIFTDSQQTRRFIALLLETTSNKNYPENKLPQT